MLAGLEQPTRGHDQRSAIASSTTCAPGERDIAMVFQSYALYPHMTVAQNIDYPLRSAASPRPSAREQVQARARRCCSSRPLLDRKPRQLSGGQQQRVALGRALVRDPAVFLLDEPLSNLDAKLRAHMRAELIELHQRIGKTMVYVTHDQLEAMTMSDRIAVHDRAAAAAVRHAAGDLPPAGQPVRRRLHRHAGDELHRGRRSGPTATGWSSRPAGCR